MIVVLIVIGWIACLLPSLILFSKSFSKEFNLDESDYLFFAFFSFIGGPISLLVSIIYFIFTRVNWKMFVEKLEKKNEI